MNPLQQLKLLWALDLIGIGVATVMLLVGFANAVWLFTIPFGVALLFFLYTSHLIKAKQETFDIRRVKFAH